MLVPLNWLKELIPIDVSPAELAHMLTMSGVEVDGVEEVAPEFSGVKVGRILKISPHPNADKLVLCKVDVGESEPLPVVCGATNIKEGDTVPMAVVGSTLSGDMKVKKAKLRGEVSFGMMCSERELGMGEDHAGIKILSDDMPIGADFAEVYGLNDVVLELGVTPNRPDCLSILGTARDVAALTGNNIKPPVIDITEADPDISSMTSVTIEDDIGCPRYAARVVNNVKVGPSPSWMADRLIKAGLRPLNNVVDVTNYALIELGHPLHAFDYHMLYENRIVVRSARSGESIVTLDDVQRELTEDMLVIADAEKPVTIAGVMGGANSEVSDSTTTVLIESAYFDPASIRRTSKALGLSTEASYRFERGADPEMVTFALDRAAELMAELSGGEVAGGVIDEYPRKLQPIEIRLRRDRIERILGIEISLDKAIAILESLGFEIVSKEVDATLVRAPSFRPDIEGEIDLIEEIARIYGYDNIASTYPEDSAIMTRGLQPRSADDVCREVLKSCGFTETITLSFGEPSQMSDFPDDNNGSPLKPILMANPLSEDESAMRTGLIPGALNCLRSNINLGAKDIKIFEVGNIYRPAEGQELPDERAMLCAAATGLSRPINWQAHSTGNVDFFEVKGVAEALLEALGCADTEIIKSSRPGFHPGSCGDIIFGDQTVGKIGEIHPNMLNKYDIGQGVFLLELDLASIDTQLTTQQTLQKASRFPHSERDLAIIVDDEVEAAVLNSAIIENGGDNLKSAFLFDMYCGEQVEEGKKSLAFSLRFQSDERTLKDEEVTAATTKIMQALESRFNAKLRA